MFPVLSTRSNPLAPPLLWERTGCWPVKKTRARSSDGMRPDIYSSSCLNNRIESEENSDTRQKGKYSEPPPNASANSKSVAAYLEDARSFFLLLTTASSFFTPNILLLVT